jgi:diaminopimelate decarboxylase
MKEVGQIMSNAFRAFCQKYGRELRLWVEPGKFLVSESGTFLAETNVVKHDPVKTFVGINSGLNHLIRPMMYGAYHYIFNASNQDSSKQSEYRVTGYICETDTFSFDYAGKQNERLLNEVKEGDIIAMANAGAYGFSMASHYNARFLPDGGVARVIRQRETLVDLLRGQER